MTPKQLRGNKLVIRFHKKAADLALLMTKIVEDADTSPRKADIHPGDFRQMQEVVAGLVKHDMMNGF
jgi:hypothetical protein